jgi:nucleoside-diphosphate-sugar epimerase
MKILVTGATGFVGSRLSVKLKEQGHDVIALGQTNNELEEARFAELAGAGIVTVRASLFDEEEIKSALEGCDFD